MIKLLLALIMMFAFGTSTVNAEENTTSIEDKISELAKTKSDNESAIKAKIDELSEDELKAVIVNVNKLEEKNLDDLFIEEAAISKLREMKTIETYYLPLGLGVVGIILMLSALIMTFTGYNDESIMPLIIGMLLLIVMRLLAKWWVQNW